MVRKFDVFFPPAGQTRRVHLYLPEGYFDTDERYPVLYMYDGHNLFFDQDATYGKCWGLKTFLDGWRKKLIVVGLECGHEGNQRLVEYCPYQVKSSFTGEISGRGEETMDWVVGTLKPMIDAQYRTIPFRECTAVAGSSMGGMMALYTVLHYNRWFSKAAAVSPAVSMAMPQFRREIAENGLSPDTKLFVSWGTKEFGKPQTQDRRMAELETRLRARGVQTRFYRHEGGGHNEASWAQEVPLWMEYLWY